MSRSLLRQLEQIRRSATYSDAVANVYTSSVAEPTVSGSLEQDLNVVRTLVKELKGTADWFGDLGNYFDPSDTDGANTENKDLNLSNLKNNTLDAKTVLLAVSDNNAGAGYTVSGTSTGCLLDITLPYATPVDRRGLPIYASTVNNGTYFDESGLDRVVRVDVLDAGSGNEIEDSNGNVIYAKMHDGADYGGTGDGTDVYMRLYANDTLTDLTSVSGVTPSALTFTYPYRKTLSSISEYEWLRTSFTSSWPGDVELVEDIHDIWSFTGASNNDGSATPWNNVTGNYLLNANPDNLKSAIDDLNDGIGDATYPSATYIISGEDVAISLASLDAAIVTNDTDISDLEDAVGSSTGLAGMDYTSTYYVSQDTDLVAAISQLDTSLHDVDDALNASSGSKYIESVASAITKNTLHSLPTGITYTPVSTAGQEGANMDVYVDGQLLAADTGTNGANADRDYAESTASGVIFRFNVQAGRNITYMVRQ